MIDPATPLCLQWKGQTITVKEHYIGEERVFRAVFTDGRKPLVITKAQANKYHAFWTSVPQGRQREAEAIGDLITMHFKTH